MILIIFVGCRYLCNELASMGIKLTMSLSSI
jgi:hypothetical protein